MNNAATKAAEQTTEPTVFEYLAPCAEGLDLNDAEDRAIFRSRVAEKTAVTKVFAMKEWMGTEANMSRHQAVHALANFYIANAPKAEAPAAEQAAAPAAEEPAKPVKNADGSYTYRGFTFEQKSSGPNAGLYIHKQNGKSLLATKTLSGMQAAIDHYVAAHEPEQQAKALTAEGVAMIGGQAHGLDLSNEAQRHVLCGRIFQLLSMNSPEVRQAIGTAECGNRFDYARELVRLYIQCTSAQAEIKLPAMIPLPSADLEYRGHKIRKLEFGFAVTLYGLPTNVGSLESAKKLVDKELDRRRDAQLQEIIQKRFPGHGMHNISQHIKAALIEAYAAGQATE
jgi:hypothetical protein